MSNSKVFLFKLILLANCLLLAQSWSMKIVQFEVCMQLNITVTPNTKYVHFRQSMEDPPVNLVFYDLQGSVMAENKQQPDDDSFFEVEFKQKGLYSFCFKKDQKEISQVHFDIEETQGTQRPAGHQEISKVANEVHEIIAFVRRIGWAIKDMLRDHQSRRKNIQNYDSTVHFAFIMKVLAMTIVVGLQIFAVTKIFRK